MLVYLIISNSKGYGVNSKKNVETVEKLVKLEVDTIPKTMNDKSDTIKHLNVHNHLDK